MAALAAGALVAVAIAGTLGSGGQPQRSSVRDQQAAVAKPATATRHRVARATTHTPVTTTGSTQTRTQTVTGTPAAATTPPPVADTLEAEGHQLMASGNFAAAIPVLRHAIAAASPNSLTYAYALYDLGRSLRLAGDPRDAVQVLYQRLQIPNQTETVRQELQLALVALGQQANGGASPDGPGPGGAPGPAGHHHPHGPPAGGGPGAFGQGNQGD